MANTRSFQEMHLPKSLCILMGLNLNMVRFFGGFPFSWKQQIVSTWSSGGKDHQDIEDESTIVTYRFEKNRSWVIWTRAMLIYYALIYLFMIYFLSFSGERDIGEYSTTEIATDVTICIMFISAIGSAVCLRRQRDSLAKLLNRACSLWSYHLPDFSYDPSRDCFFLTNYGLINATFLVEAVYGISAGVVAVQANGLRWSVEMKSALQFNSYLWLRMSTSGALSFTLILFTIIIALFSYVYKSCLPTQNDDLDTEDAAVLFHRRAISVNCQENPSLQTELYETSVVVKQQLLTDIERSRKKILAIHEVLRLFNKYFTDPAYILLLYSVISIIYSSFNIIKGLCTVSEVILSLSIWVRSSCFIYILCKAPDFAKEERDNLLHRILILRSKVNAQENNELGRLLELMTDYPDFNMGNLFFIGKARFLEISSFIATYVVILLQFNSSESDSSSWICGNLTRAD